MKGSNRSGNDRTKLARALGAKGKTPTDRGGKNLGTKGNKPFASGRREEHSRIAKGNRTQQGRQ